MSLCNMQVGDGYNAPGGVRSRNGMLIRSG